MENKQLLYVFNTVSDEDIRESFEQLFDDVGNNVVERIEVIGDKKMIHISDAVYAASIASPDNFFKFFDYDEILTFGIYQGDWVIGCPEDFKDTTYFYVYKM
jgi:hypothetical protein